MPPKSSPLRKAASFAGLTFAGIVGTAVFATSAHAHHPEIVASADCAGVVSYTSEAWATGDPAARTNPDIDILYSVDGGAFVEVPESAAHRYDAGNGYTFSGTLPALPGGWGTVRVKAYAVANWGSGADGDDERTTGDITPATGCDTPAEPAATIGAPDCVEGAVLVTLTNTGGKDATFTITVDGVDQTVVVGPGETEEVPLDVPFDEVTDITVSANGMDDETTTVDYDCAVPSAVVAGAECADGGAVVTLKNDGDAPATFTVTAGGTSTDHTLLGGEERDVPVTFPAGSPESITVTAAGMADVVAEDLTYTCSPNTPATTPPPPPTPPTTDMPGTPVVVEEPTFSAPPVFEPVTLPADNAPVVEPEVEGETATNGEPATVEPAPPGVLGTSAGAAAPSGSLPRTGGSASALALTGVGSVLAGLALALSSRRRRTA